MLSEHRADVALRHEPPESGDFYVAKLGTFAIAVYRCRGAEAAAWVSYTEEQAHWPTARWVQRQIEETGMPAVCRASSMLMRVEAIRAGTSRGELPCYVGDGHPLLERLTPPIPELAAEYWIMVHRDLRRAPCVRAAIDWMRAVFSEQRDVLAGVAWIGKIADIASDALVDQLREECRGDREPTPLGVKRRGRLGRDGLVEGTALLLELRDVRADGDAHVVKRCQLRLVAHRARVAGHVVAGNDDGLVADGGDVCFRCLDDSVDATSGRVIDEWVEAVPKRISAMQDVSLGERDRNVAVRVRRTVILQMQCGTAARSGADTRRLACHRSANA
jgi:hypothetical protein